MKLQKEIFEPNIKRWRSFDSLWQNSTSIYDKNSPESRNRRNIAQHNKSYIWQTHSKHYPQRWKIESVSPKVRNKTRVPTFTATIQHSSGSFGNSNQSRKINKRNPNWKRSKTLTVCNDIILYTENPKDSTRKLLELVNEYSRVAGCILVLTQLSFGEILAELKFLKWRRYIKLKSIVGTFKRLEFNS